MDLVTLTKEILNEKLHFLCSGWSIVHSEKSLGKHFIGFKIDQPTSSLSKHFLMTQSCVCLENTICNHEK